MLATPYKEDSMKQLLVVLLALACGAAYAQAPSRIRGTITSLEGDVLSVKTRDGKDVKLQLAPDAGGHDEEGLGRRVQAGKLCRRHFGQKDGRLVAVRVHALAPQVPQGHRPWDLIPVRS